MLVRARDRIQPSSLSRSSSASFDTQRRLSQRGFDSPLEYSAENSQDEVDQSTESNLDTDAKPWAETKARAGRGELFGQVLASKHDITLVVQLIVSAWASGEKGLEWLFWPDEDQDALAEAIRGCWTQVVLLEEGGIVYPNTNVEPLIGRKVYSVYTIFRWRRVNSRQMKDAIGDRRSQIMAHVRTVVRSEFQTRAASDSKDVSRGFWESLEKDHAVLSPNPRLVNYSFLMFGL